MLVKFKPNENNAVSPVLIDSSKISAEGSVVYHDNRKKSWIVDDATLAYLEGAWAHEGMRRVKTIYDESNKSYLGWMDSGGSVYLDNGYAIKSKEKYTFKLIPYEMEEQV